MSKTFFVSSSRQARPTSAGFTLVELMVSISIITLLIAILLPALKHSRSVANLTICKNNLRQVYIGSFGYAMDCKSVFPNKETNGGRAYRIAPGLISDPTNPSSLPETYGWAATLDKCNYMPGNSKVWVCREQPLQSMQEMGNTYAFSIAGVLDDRRVEDVKMPATLLMWDNAIYNATQSGVYNGTLSIIPTSQRQMVHRLGNVSNVNNSVVQLYGDGRVRFFLED